MCFKAKSSIALLANLEHRLVVCDRVEVICSIFLDVFQTIRGLV